MNEPLIRNRLNRPLDWAGLIVSCVLLVMSVREHRDGGSVGWPIGGVALVLTSLWVVYRGRPRRGGGTTATPEE